VPAPIVHTWFRATAALDAAAIATAAAVLSDDERAQFNRFHFARDARDYAAAHELLRRTLSRDDPRTPDQWRFDKDLRGKPFLIDAGTCRASFSLSHTRGMVACAVTQDAAVGVDVECIDREVDTVEIASRFFAPAEAAHLRTLDEETRRGRFFELWTLKEALVKALGTGMAAALNQLAFTVSPTGIGLDAPAEIDADAWAFGLIAPGPRYRLAAAVRRSGPAVPQLIFQSLAHDV
jgi:4'-phosphopantetheinyl transferase